jgi:hypothetical protein
MQISTTGALSLLKKWHEEKRLVNCAIITIVGGEVFQIVSLYGSISDVGVEDAAIHIDVPALVKETTHEADTCSYVKIPLSEARYEYVEPDHSDIKDEEERDVLSYIGEDRFVESSLRIRIDAIGLVFALEVVVEGLRIEKGFVVKS